MVDRIQENRRTGDRKTNQEGPVEETWKNQLWKVTEPQGMSRDRPGREVEGYRKQ